MSEVRPMNAGDHAGLELLIADRDGAGEGITAAELRTAAATRFLPSFISRLREHGYIIGISPSGRYELGHDSASTGASDERRPALVKGSGPAPAGTIGQASEAPVEAELSLFPDHTPRQYREAA